MKKSNLLFRMLVVLLLFPMMSCSSDDVDYRINELVGTWYLVGYNNGWGQIDQFDEGEIIVTFTREGQVIIVNNREDQQPLSTGNHTYALSLVESSIYNHEKSLGISFDGGLLYSYSFIDGMLHISAEALDGPGYSFKKVWPGYNL